MADSFLNNVAGFQPSDLQHMCFYVSFAKFLLTPFLPEVLRLTVFAKCKLLLLSLFLLIMLDEAKYFLPLLF